MAAALWLSGPRDVRHFIAAMACGVATALACIVPCLPWEFEGGTPALLTGLAVAVVLGGVVCWLREEHGWVAVAETYGVLAAAGLLCWGSSFT